MTINEFERAKEILEEIERLSEKLDTLCSDRSSITVGDGCRVFYNIRLNKRSASPYAELARKLMDAVTDDINMEIKKLNEELDSL